jgi:hypothetical protein
MAGNGLRDLQRETAAQGDEHATLLEEAKSGSSARHLAELFDIAQELSRKVLQETLRSLL